MRTPYKSATTKSNYVYFLSSPADSLGQKGLLPRADMNRCLWLLPSPDTRNADALTPADSVLTSSGVTIAIPFPLTPIADPKPPPSPSYFAHRTRRLSTLGLLKPHARTAGAGVGVNPNPKPETLHPQP